MEISLQINGISKKFSVHPADTLFKVLRIAGYYSIKFGDEQGFSGVDTVLLDGKPVNSGMVLAAQAEGHQIVTAEALGTFPDQGWNKSGGLHPLQLAFIDTGAIQCGYCTPSQLLAAKALLDVNKDPSEDEVREAISGVLCRCTGYQKPVEAIIRAAAILRGDIPKNPYSNFLIPLENNRNLSTVGKSVPKSDAVKLSQGKPAFTADLEMSGMLFAKVLHSPHAHAQIRSINVDKAKLLPGVAAILTWKDIRDFI